MKHVKVEFPRNDQNKLYSYVCFDDKVQVEDIALIFTPDGFFTAAIVKAVDDVIPASATKAVTKVINPVELALATADAQAKVDEYREAKVKLKSMLAEFQEMQVYEMLASANPEAAFLLNKIKHFQ